MPDRLLLPLRNQMHCGLERQQFSWQSWRKLKVLITHAWEREKHNEHHFVIGAAMPIVVIMFMVMMMVVAVMMMVVVVV